MRQNKTALKWVVIVTRTVVGLLLAGLIVGALAGLAGALIPGIRPATFGWVSGASAGIIIGYPVGVIIGLVFIAKILHYRGSLLLGILGILIGMGITAGFWYILQDDKDVSYLITSFIVAPIILGALGYYLMNKEKPAVNNNIRSFAFVMLEASKGGRSIWR